MTKHLNTDQVAMGTFYLLFHHLTVDFSHLVHIQFTGQYHHVGKLRIELQSLNVRNIELRGEMNLQSDTAAIGHHRHIRGNHRRNTCLMGSITNFVHGRNILTIDNRIHGKVALHPVFITGSRNLS